MSKNKKPMTEAQREAKRIRDRKYRAAKKAAKIAEAKKQTAKKPKAEPIPVKKGETFIANGKKYVSIGGNKAVEVKKPEAKKVAKPVKTALPKVQTAEVEPVRIHTIKPGDVIRFEGFTQERILDYANRLIMSVGYDRMEKLMKVVSEKQKTCKSCKK